MKKTTVIISLLLIILMPLAFAQESTNWFDWLLSFFHTGATVSSDCNGNQACLTCLAGAHRCSNGNDQAPQYANGICGWINVGTCSTAPTCTKSGKSISYYDYVSSSQKSATDFCEGNYLQVYTCHISDAGMTLNSEYCSNGCSNGVCLGTATGSYSCSNGNVDYCLSGSCALKYNCPSGICQMPSDVSDYTSYCKPIPVEPNADCKSYTDSSMCNALGCIYDTSEINGQTTCCRKPSETCSLKSLCGNGVCAGTETLSNCPADCKIVIPPTCSSYTTAQSCLNAGCQWGNGGLCSSDVFNPNGSVSFSDIKSVPVLKEDIAKKTAAELSSSLCLTTNKCATGENITVECLSLAYLDSQKLLLDKQKNDIMQNGKTILVSTSIGAGAGLTVCSIIAGVGSAFLSPAFFATVLPCASIVTGATALVATAFVVDTKDPLIAALNAKDPTKVGLCVYTPKQAGSFDFCSITSQIPTWIGQKADCATGTMYGAIGLILIFVLISVLPKR